MTIKKDKYNEALFNQYAIEGEIGFFREGNQNPDYIYDITKLNASQFFDAKLYFDMELTSIEKPPQDVNQMQRTTDRQMAKKAFAAILMKPIYEVDKDTNSVKRVGLDKYDSTSPKTINALDEIIGLENIDKLEKVKTDFFYRSGLIQKVWQKQITEFSKHYEKQSSEEKELVKEAMRDLYSNETLSNASTQQVVSKMQ